MVLFSVSKISLCCEPFELSSIRPMGVSNKKWASSISVIASSLFAFLIVFQVPLFRVACGKKSYETPLEVISSQLIGFGSARGSQVIPLSLVKILLYPGAFAKSLISGSGLPDFHKLLSFYHKNTSTDIHHLEVFAGSCLCLLGALLSLFKPTRISFIGTLLIFWGLIRDILLLDSSHNASWRSASAARNSNSVRVYPTLFLASLSAFLSIRSDVRKIIRCCRSKPLSKSL